MKVLLSRFRELMMEETVTALVSTIQFREEARAAYDFLTESDSMDQFGNLIASDLLTPEEVLTLVKKSPGAAVRINPTSELMQEPYASQLVNIIVGADIKTVEAIVFHMGANGMWEPLTQIYEVMGNRLSVHIAMNNPIPEDCGLRILKASKKVTYGAKTLADGSVGGLGCPPWLLSVLSGVTDPPFPHPLWDSLSEGTRARAMQSCVLSPFTPDELVDRLAAMDQELLLLAAYRPTPFVVARIVDLFEIYYGACADRNKLTAIITAVVRSLKSTRMLTTFTNVSTELTIGAFRCLALIMSEPHFSTLSGDYRVEVVETLLNLYSTYEECRKEPLHWRTVLNILRYAKDGQSYMADISSTLHLVVDAAYRSAAANDGDAQRLLESLGRMGGERGKGWFVSHWTQAIAKVAASRTNQKKR